MHGDMRSWSIKCLISKDYVAKKWNMYGRGSKVCIVQSMHGSFSPILDQDER